MKWAGVQNHSLGLGREDTDLWDPNSFKGVGLEQEDERGLTFAKVAVY